MMKTGRYLLLLISIFCAGVHGREVPKHAGNPAGLTVLVGCDADQIREELGHGRFVHGLVLKEEDVGPVRANCLDMGIADRCLVDRLDGGGLPHADNLVNRIVISDQCSVISQEIHRVLAPRGVALLHSSSLNTETRNLKPQSPAGLKGWTVYSKPVPTDIDEWTHYHHDSDGNVVSPDLKVAPPTRLQWHAGPEWSRSHEGSPSTSAAVTGGGKLFTIQENNVVGINSHYDLPVKWLLRCRDAFNGILLWDRPIDQWGVTAWKSGGHWGDPKSLPRRMVYGGNDLFVTLGYRAPVSVIDPATGEIRKVLSETDNTEELLYQGGTLVVRTRKGLPDAPNAGAHPKPRTGRKGTPDRKNAARDGNETILAIDPVNNKVLWKHHAHRIVMLTLACDQKRVCYHDYQYLVCLDKKTGKRLWEIPCGTASFGDESACSLALAKDTVVVNSPGGMRAFSAVDGKQLWHIETGFFHMSRHTGDIFVVDDLVWVGISSKLGMEPMSKEETDRPELKGVLLRPREAKAVAVDLKTGKVARTLELGELISVGHHTRCYRGKATKNYMIWPKRGAEFIGIGEGTKHMRVDWARSECGYGVLPSSGMLYTFPHPCNCYSGVTLTGYNALAGYPRKQRVCLEKADVRLIKGPAYGISSDGSGPQPGDWPTYRADARRRGYQPKPLPGGLKQSWKTELQGPLTPPVMASGCVFVAARDHHVLYCLDAASGKQGWKFFAGGRIDSPPTLLGGKVFFGCCDGCVYCLRASDGQLSWKYRAAPEDYRIVNRDQVESAWPVHGSVLAVNDLIYGVAGRNTYLDGGLYLFALEPATGRVVHSARLDGPHIDVMKTMGAPYALIGCRADILSSDGKTVNLMYHEFDMSLVRNEMEFSFLARYRVAGAPRLMPLHGYLDTDYFNRTFWIFGNQWPGRPAYDEKMTGFTGQLIVMNDAQLITFQVFPYKGGKSGGKSKPGDGYGLRASRLNKVHETRMREIPRGGKKNKGVKESGGGEAWKRVDKEFPVRGRGMVLAGNHVFAAGTAGEQTDDPEKLLAALRNQGPAELWRIIAKDGEVISKLKLTAAPVFDGLIAAGDRILISLEDGTVVCLDESEGR